MKGDNFLHKLKIISILVLFFFVFHIFGSVSVYAGILFNDNISSYKGQNYIKDYSGLNIGLGNTGSVTLSDISQTGLKINLTGARLSDLTVITPEINNIEGSFIIRNMTSYYGGVVNDIVILKGITNISDLINKIDSISISNGDTYGNNNYNNYSLNLNNGGKIVFENLFLSSEESIGIGDYYSGLANELTTINNFLTRVFGTFLMNGDGVCGTSAGQTFKTVPKSNLCLVGINSIPIINGNNITWTCNGVSGGENTLCTAFYESPSYDGVCGTSNGQSFSSLPVSNLCYVGFSTGATISQTGITWTCNGINGGNNTSCNALYNLPITNGECGTARGQSFDSVPINDLCKAGTNTGVVVNGTTINWVCNGLNGGTNVDCLADYETQKNDGICGSSAGQTFDHTPVINLCSSGTTNGASINGSSINWVCYGFNGGVDANCTAMYELSKINGSCGSSQGQTFNTTPTNNLCSAGVSTGAIISGTGISWICNGLNGGTNSNCTAMYELPKIDGKCGSSNGETLDYIPENNLCSSGTTTGVTVNIDVVSWTCKGLDGGTDTNCSATFIPDGINGICGSASGSTFSSPPPNNTLCFTGTSAGTNTVGDKIYWLCDGLNGGYSAFCEANFIQQTENGLCGTASGREFDSLPINDLCEVGTNTGSMFDPLDNTKILWSCNGLAGGTISNCNAIYNAGSIIQATCGLSSGKTFYKIPGNNLCGEGSASIVNLSGSTLSWSCSLGGTSVNCNASYIDPNMYNGVCGSSNGKTFNYIPSQNLCSSGTTIGVELNGNGLSWSCEGQRGGSFDFCNATYLHIPLNADCGSASGKIFDFVPNTNLCSVGSTSGALINGTNINWLCNGLYGGNNLTCSAIYNLPGKENGTCGSSAGKTFDVLPTDNLCNSGVSLGATINGTGITWTCNGINGGTNSICNAIFQDVNPENGTCGSSQGQIFNILPNTNLCSKGFSSGAIISGTGITWICRGLNGGGNTICNATYSILAEDGICGTASGQNFNMIPTENLCSGGNTLGAYINGNSINWTCNGLFGGTSVSCNAIFDSPIASGSCGTSSGQTFSIPPISDLCSVGTSTGTTINSNNIDWFCNGINGGSNSYCSAVYDPSKSQNGVCGSSSGKSFINKPNTNLCLFGNDDGVTISGSLYIWTCNGINGGTDSNCSANISWHSQINGICGSANDGFFSFTPTINLCYSGVNTLVVKDGNKYKWLCNGINGGINSSCQANYIEPVIVGICGNSAGQTFNSQPKTDLCKMGTATNVSISGKTFTWICKGSLTVYDKTCTANYDSGGGSSGSSGGSGGRAGVGGWTGVGDNFPVVIETSNNELKIEKKKNLLFFGTEIDSNIAKMSENFYTKLDYLKKKDNIKEGIPDLYKILILRNSYIEKLGGKISQKKVGKRFVEIVTFDTDNKLFKDLQLKLDKIIDKKLNTHNSGIYIYELAFARNNFIMTVDKILKAEGNDKKVLYNKLIEAYELLLIELNK